MSFCSSFCGEFLVFVGFVKWGRTLSCKFYIFFGDSLGWVLTVFILAFVGNNATFLEIVILGILIFLLVCY